MEDSVYTLGVWRVRPGNETAFIADLDADERRQSRMISLLSAVVRVRLP
jgi:hypothetical protein